jgi:hypothetical protein
MQPLTEMSTRNLPGSKGRPARKADNLTAICEPIAYKMWQPRRLKTLWPVTVTGMALPFYGSFQLSQKTASNGGIIEKYLEGSVCSVI